MAAITWFATSNLAGPVHQEMSETDPGTEAYASPVTGWIVSTGSTNHSPFNSQVEQAAATFADTVPPDGSPDTSTGDCLRSTNQYTGSFANANWNIHFACQANTNGGSQDGRMRCRLLRGANADGSGATEITAAQQQGGLVTNLAAGTTQVSTATFNPGAFSVSGEYIFIQLAWERTGAGAMTTSDVNMRVGNSAGTGTRVISADFSLNLAPSLYDDTETFFSPTVASTYNLAPTLYNDADTFFSSTVTSTYNLAPPLYDDTDVFFSPTVSQEGGTQNLAPSLYADADTFHSPTVLSTYNLQPSLYSDVDTFFTPIVLSTYDLAPALYSDTDNFFSPIVSTTYDLTPAFYNDTDTFFSPTVSQPGAEQNLQPSLFVDTDSFFVPIVAASYALLPTAFADPDVFFSPTVVLGAPDLRPELFVDADIFYTAIISGGVSGRKATRSRTRFEPVETRVNTSTDRRRN